ncbi:MAG: adenylate/guanylate cyclase domain-containing protein [Rhodospirillales bacterium]
MRLNIAQKIFGIAVVVLVLMAAVAVLSIHLTEEIADQLDEVAGRQLPISDTIGEINVHILEQGLLLQQLFALQDESRSAIARVKSLGRIVDQSFAEAHALFAEEAASEYRSESILKLNTALKRVEDEYRKFEQHGLALLALHGQGDTARFEALLPDLNAQQDAIDREIYTLRGHVETVVDEAVKRADASQKALLWINAVLTGLASILGLGIAGWVTALLVRNIRFLAGAAEQVEGGALDVEVPINSSDEVGRLSASFNNMVSGLRMKERIKDTFGKYMDPRIVSQLLENPDFTKLGGQRHEMTVMFIDMKGYTTLSEQLPPADLINMINGFLGEMTEAISAHNGVVNDFLGDAVMAYWGPPFTEADEHAKLACDAALAALRNFDRFRAAVSAELGPRAEGLDIDMRIGLSTGLMTVGNIGSSASRKFSVIGDPVNLGARLESANKNYGTRVMLSERTRDLAGDAAPVRELDLIRVKGKAQPTRVFELLAAPAPDDRLARALAAYRAQDWDRAEAAFTALRDDTPRDDAPNDPVPAVFLGRIQHLRANPPGADWDGVWAFETK